MVRDLFGFRAVWSRGDDGDNLTVCDRGIRWKLRTVRLFYGGLSSWLYIVIGRTTLEEPEIAYELFQHAHGNGYATEAAQAIMKIAKATGRKRLWSTGRNPVI